MSFGSVVTAQCHDYFLSSPQNTADVIYTLPNDLLLPTDSSFSTHYPNSNQLCYSSQILSDVFSEATNYYSSEPAFTTFEKSAFQNSISIVEKTYLKAPNKNRSAMVTERLFTPRPRVVKRRVSANKKERRRTLSINSAFSDLRDCVPFIPPDTKLSKIKTLRLATSYIAYLMDFLEEGNSKELPEGGFQSIVTKTLESREDRRKRDVVKVCSLGDCFEIAHYVL